MKKYNQVETGKMAAKNAAFVLAYSDIKGCNRDDLNALTRVITLIVRKAGDFGIPGGKLDPGETLVEGAIRECIEEIGYQFHPDNLELFCSHEIEPGFNSHLFLCNVDETEFPDHECDIYDIQAASIYAKCTRTEHSGLVVFQVSEESVNNLLDTPAAPTLHEEFDLLYSAGVLEWF